MKSFLLACLMFGLAMAISEQEYQSSFTSWMQANQKSYNHEEFRVRYYVYRSNLDYINQFNSENHEYTLAMNQLGDLTSAEYKKFLLGLQIPETVPEGTPSPVSALPTSFDWRQQGAVTAVKNQEQCGSCWAFSTTGSTEGCHFLTTKNLVSVSEQQLVDCSGSYGNEGCNGGLMTQAMQYIIDTKGIDTEDSYPYTAQDGTCSFNANNIGATLASFTNVATGSESDLQQKVYQGPTSVAIDASHSSFQFYSSGVYNEPACSPTALDHGVLAVGWGTSGSDYWIVKNSWGTGWGQNGYIWMTRNKNNQCGIATMATLPSC